MPQLVPPPPEALRYRWSSPVVGATLTSDVLGLRILSVDRFPLCRSWSMSLWPRGCPGADW